MNFFRHVSSFEQLTATPFEGENNAIGWDRKLKGDFNELIESLRGKEYLQNINEEDLLELELSDQGQIARSIILDDLKLLLSIGASPSINVIGSYEKDTRLKSISTDVYSFHKDQSTVPTDTYLCTYYGAGSEILPNFMAQKKVFIPEVIDEIKTLYTGPAEGFEEFLKDEFFDLHYLAKPSATIFELGVGHMWRLAVEYPGCEVEACIHRAPPSSKNCFRLLLIS